MSLVTRVATVTDRPVADFDLVLQELLYGEITTEADAEALRIIAEHYDVDVDLLIPATGDITTTESLAPINPHATYSQDVTVYAEDSNELVTDIPESRGTAEEDPVAETDDQDEDPDRAAWEHVLHTHVWADVAALTGASPGEIACIIRPWVTARAAMAGMTKLIARRRAARAPRRNTVAAALAA